MGQFALDIFSLPHSSATCERVSSKINNVQTKLRNRMFSTTLQSLIRASEYIAKTGCYKFRSTEKMLSYMNASNIYEQKKQLQNNLPLTISEVNISSSVGEIYSDSEIILDLMSIIS